MSARGYYQAFQTVKESIKTILEGKNAGEVADNDHGDCYRELFAPSVTVGILKAGDLAGYRSAQVYIKGSMHTPLNPDAVRDAMPVLFDLLKEETHAGVRAVLGHFLFVFIHPYMDGNGRIGRFLFNVMLASGGYSWTVIPLAQRDAYMASLEKASVQIKHFVGVIQVDGLFIEILPKVDKGGSKDYWRGILIQMLKTCGRLKPESAGGANKDHPIQLRDRRKGGSGITIICNPMLLFEIQPHRRFLF
jgi:hypothetical protein